MISRTVTILIGVALAGWVAGCAQQKVAQPAGTPPGQAKAAAAGPEAAATPAPAQEQNSRPAAVQDEKSGAAGMARIVTADGIELKAIYFDYDQYEIKPDYRDEVAYDADVLKKHPGKVVIEGHCDERGTTEYNLALGQRRAMAVRDALRGDGVATPRMKVVSFGSERPADAGHNEQAWAKNRRGALEMQ
jgi:peptidoglycan-associated lipoprotein